MTLLRSWVESANNATSPFPLNNLPYGVFSVQGGAKRCGVAIGDFILDCTALERHVRWFEGKALPFETDDWTLFMALGQPVWRRYREFLQWFLGEGNQTRPLDVLVRMDDVKLHLPFRVSEFTDFYASRHHAMNVGTMFRGAENALPPNWLHIPIGYNGRASSVVVSGTDVQRPWGQVKGPDDAMPRFAPSARFDIELEIGAIIGQPSRGPLSLPEADANIFGYVLLNDWSARDIQAWEYQPLGPFQAKATATTISPWIVTADALAPFRCNAPAREVDLLPHLQDAGPMHFDIDLEVTLAPERKAATTIARTNAKELYYSAAQQLAHHTTSGCPMRVGDLLGSGTISGPGRAARGSLLELSWGGAEPLTLDTGDVRTFITDNDALTLTGAARGNGYRIGFGTCVGTVRPAAQEPYRR